MTTDDYCPKYCIKCGTHLVSVSTLIWSWVGGCACVRDALPDNFGCRKSSVCCRRSKSGLSVIRTRPKLARVWWNGAGRAELVCLQPDKRPPHGKDVCQRGAGVAASPTGRTRRFLTCSPFASDKHPVRADATRTETIGSFHAPLLTAGFHASGIT